LRLRAHPHQFIQGVPPIFAMRGNLNFASQKSMEHPVAVICNRGKMVCLSVDFFSNLMYAVVVDSYFFFRFFDDDS